MKDRYRGAQSARPAGNGVNKPNHTTRNRAPKPRSALLSSLASSDQMGVPRSEYLTVQN